MRHTRIVVTRYGGPDVLQVLEEECPEPKPGEVRVRVHAAGVSLPDVLAREGVHPETPTPPFTPGWDLVGEVDRLGDGVSGIEPGRILAAMPISGAYAELVCVPQSELVPVPSGLDPAEAVSLVLNSITACQMLHHCAKVRSGQRVPIHGAAGGVGTALLQLGRLAELEMYGTCSARGAPAVSELGGIPIHYEHQDIVGEILRLTKEGVDAVFDPIGGLHLWMSRKALRPGGRVVGYGLSTSLRGKGLTSSRPGRRPAIPSCRGKTGAGAARERRRGRQDRARAARLFRGRDRGKDGKRELALWFGGWHPWNARRRTTSTKSSSSCSTPTSTARSTAAGFSKRPPSSPSEA